MDIEYFNKDILYSDAFVYWLEEWKAISEEIKNGLIGIDIVNIRTVLSDLINEYELNKFESENNRKVYISLIENLNKEKHIHLYREELRILKEKLETKDFFSVYVIAKELSKKISKESFSKILFDELLFIIERKLFSKSDREKVKNITKDIIIELVNLGLNSKDINDIVDGIFNSYFIDEGKEDSDPIILFEHTPKELSPKEAKEYIDNLTLRDRFILFKEQLSPQTKVYKFIFPLWGMESYLKSSNETLMDIEIYNPQIERKIQNKDWYDERFLIEKDNNQTIESKFNVLVHAEAISYNYGKKIAEEKYLFFLSILNLEFSGEYTEIYWDGQFICLDKEDTPISGTAFGTDTDERIRRRNISRNSPINLAYKKYEKIKYYSSIIEILNSRSMHNEINSIINVIELISKSKWETDENKLLNYWICLESLANISKNNNETKFKFIKETVSNMYFLWEQYSPLHNLFILSANYTFSGKKYKDTINIPKEFIEDVGINKYHSEDEIPLFRFYARMNELLNYTALDRYLDEIKFTIDFYKDNKLALDLLRNKRKQVGLTIDYIYKTRNQIVHNGYVAKNLVPYLVRYAEGYANSLLKRIIHVYHEDEFDLQSYFVKERYKGDLLEKKLASKQHFEIVLKE